MNPTNMRLGGIVIGTLRPKCRGLSRILIVAITVIVLIVAIIGGYVYYQTLTPTDNIRIGMIAPQTGSLAYGGTDMKLALQMEADKVNAQGGLLPGRNVTLAIADDEGKPETGYSATEKVLSVDKVHASVGVLTSSVGLAIQPLFKAYKTPVVIVCAANVNITAARNPYVFRTVANTSDPCYVTAIDGFWTNYSLPKTVTAILENMDLARGNWGIYKSYLTSHGWTINGEYWVNSGTQDFYSILNEIKTHEPALLLAIVTGVGTSSIVKQARELGIQAKIAGTTGDFGGMEFANLCGDNCIGVMNLFSVAQGANSVSKQFTEEFKEKFGHAPGTYALLMKSGVDALFDAIKRAGSTDPEAICQALRGTNIQTSLVNRLTFEPTCQQNVNQGAVLLQWKKVSQGNYTLKIVWPKESQEMTPIL